MLHFVFVHLHIVVWRGFLSNISLGKIYMYDSILMISAAVTSLAKFGAHCENLLPGHSIWRTCAYQGGVRGRNVGFSENFAYFLNGWFLAYHKNSNVTQGTLHFVHLFQDKLVYNLYFKYYVWYSRVDTKKGKVLEKPIKVCDKKVMLDLVQCAYLDKGCSR